MRPSETAEEPARGAASAAELKQWVSKTTPEEEAAV